MPDIELQLERSPPRSRLRRERETPRGGLGVDRDRGPSGRGLAFAGDPAHGVGIAPRHRGEATNSRVATGALVKKRISYSELLKPIDVEEFATLAICPASDTWHYITMALRAGLSIGEIFEDLIAPAARRLGDLWESDDCDFLAVTIGTDRLQTAVRRLSQIHGNDRASHAQALFCPAPGEVHVLGLAMAQASKAADGLWSPPSPTSSTPLSVDAGSISSPFRSAANATSTPWPTPWSAFGDSLGIARSSFWLGVRSWRPTRALP